jgi:uncharacterized SAM-binding protein YcdF (DUF218 family)
MLFFARRLLEGFLLPLSVVLFAIGIGVLLRRTRRFGRAGRYLFGGGLVGIVALSYGVPFDLIARRLQDRYPPLLHRPSDVHWIVVLGGDVHPQPGLPVSAYPGQASIYRIVEGVRLQREAGDAGLIFTGYAGDGATSTAAAGAALARALGVPDSLIVTEDRPRTTVDEAVRIRQRVDTAPFVLVTSALHMPRAMRIFGDQGMHPVPAPTGYRDEIERITVQDWIVPSGRRIALAADVFHELAGLLVQRLRR